MNSLELLPKSFIATYIFIFGLCIGSFLNVAILRGLAGEEMVKGRSRCPKCKNQLKWYMNIPLLSYLFLRGQCAFCKCKISFQYPLVEFVCACLFLISYLVFGFSLKALFMCIFFVFFILMSATDFIETVIIDIHAYLLLIAALLYSYLKLGDINIIQALIGAAFGFIFFEILARLGKIFTGCRAFGEGDSLIALGLGSIFGWKVLLIIIALSFIIQSFSAIPVLVKKAFDESKIKLGISYIFVLLAMLLLVILNQFNLIKNELIYLAVVIVTVIGLIWSLKNVIAEIKNKKLDDSKDEEEKFCLMPFGPALIFASMICIFFLKQVKNWILDYLS